MNTMYASVGARTREIGTLRVLGFRRRAVLIGFLLEGALLAFVGGVLGCLLALPMNGYSTGTISFETFSEIVFQFRITPWLAAKAATPSPTPAAAQTASGSVLTVSGYIVNRARIELSPRFEGTVKWIGVKKGDRVAKDQVVVMLDDAEQRARLLEAQGRLSSA